MPSTDSPDYQPQPIDTSGVTLPVGLDELRELLAENTHDHWALQRMSEGWTFGPQRNDESKQHPDLIPYDQLPEGEKEYDRKTAMEALKTILAKGYRILPPEDRAPAPAPAAAPEAVSPLMRHLDGNHPKRILALDGGGIKGVLTLGFVERLEAKLADRLHQTGKLKVKENFRLCQYFDLIGGTSTGSIIAAALAKGWKASELKQSYLDLGGDVFKGDRGTLGMMTGSRFNSKALARHLYGILGDITLGSPELRTGLCVVAKRADTQSTWPLINHPRGKYYEYNAPLVLWRAVRASTAAPTFFRPQVLPTGNRNARGKLEKGAFYDGGVSMANNPSLQCFLAAVLKGFPFHWNTGEENLMVVSMGTGTARIRKTVRQVLRYGLIDLVREIPQMLMDDANWQNQLLLQALSNSPTRWEIDSEVGDGYEDMLGGKPLLHYVRYDALLEKDYLENLGMPEMAAKAVKLMDMAQAKNRYDLARIGEVAAARDIPEDPALFEQHFPSRFDHVIE